MSGTRLHFLDARGRIGLNRPWLTRTANDAMLRIRTIADPGEMDIAFRPEIGVPAETGHAGLCLGAGHVVIAVDPGNPELTRNRNGGLQRTLAQECALSMRYEHMGIGVTLGELMVEAGLALRFEELAFGAAEPEDATLIPMIEAALREAHRAWDSRVFDREAWFGGPRGTAIGHAAGHRLVGLALGAEGPESVLDTIAWSAGRFAPYAG